jgi:hypothetical protein
VTKNGESRILCYLAILGGCVLMALPFIVHQSPLRYVDLPAGAALVVVACVSLKRHRRRRVRL